MMRLTNARIEMAREFLKQYESIDNRGVTTRQGWIALKFSCSRDDAQKLIDKIELQDKIRACDVHQAS